MNITLGQYILNDERKPVACPDLMEWGKWLEVRGNRRVAEDKVGDAKVSTVFLGLDHNWSNVGPPLLFETMIFGGERDGYQERCSTWAEAEDMHREAVNLARSFKQEGKR